MMELAIGILIVLGYMEVRDYRQSRRLRRVQLAVSQLTRRVDAARLSDLPSEIRAMASEVATASGAAQEAKVLSETLLKEYQIVAQYKRQTAELARADYFEG